MNKPTIPCLCCGKKLTNITGDVQNQPEDGVTFTSPGTYGSRVFDPLDGTYLEVNVCDACLTQAKTKGRVLTGQYAQAVIEEGVITRWEKVAENLKKWS